MTVRNFQNYASEKYIEPAYRLAEEGIYRGTPLLAAGIRTGGNLCHVPDL